MSSAPPVPTSPLVHRHLRFGWCSLLLFVSVGIVLEAMHGLKIGWYLGEAFETRRLMWTLAHAHGTLLSLVHIALAASIAVLPELFGGRARFTSTSLLLASVLLPGGFALGGIFIYDGDPGVGVFLAPVGALFMWLAVAGIAMAAVRATPTTAAES